MSVSDNDLKAKWEEGLSCGSIIRDLAPGEIVDERMLVTIGDYGGIVIAESMYPGVRDHIIKLHNDKIGRASCRERV